MRASGVQILIVEDETKMAELLRRGLLGEGVEAVIADSGERALALAARQRYDAIVLDVLLPGIDGFETCERLRKSGVEAPVLMLTALGSIEDRVAGLDGGADDYVTKPFSFAELLARIRALVRRLPPRLTVGELAMDLASHRVWRGGRELDLTAREFSMFEAFMRRPGDVLTRLYLLQQAWDYEFEHRSNVIDVYVRYLRQKIDRPFGVESIETVRGAGYRLRRDGGA